LCIFYFITIILKISVRALL